MLLKYSQPAVQDTTRAKSLLGGMMGAVQQIASAQSEKKMTPLLLLLASWIPY
jgi:hypothetical protein